MPILLNKTGAIRGLPAGEIEGRKVHSQVLSPGANEVTRDQIALAKTVPVTKALFAKGKLVEKNPPPKMEEPPPAGEPVEDLTALNVRPAKDLVRDCDDVEQLRHWMELEHRKTVQETILARYEELVGSAQEEGETDEQGDELED